MRPDSLNSFISMLETAGQLHRIRCQVDTDLELAAVVARACKSVNANKGLLFENVTGSNLPVAVNLFGSLERMAICLGVFDLDSLVAKVSEDLAATSAADSTAAITTLSSTPATQSVTVDTAPWQSNDLTAQGLGCLPALRSWPGDGGRYFTLGQVFTCHPKTRALNCGMYRLQLVESHKALLRCHPGSGGAHHLQAWQEQGEAMPVAVALGGPPSLTWAAGISLPSDVAEADYVGYLTGNPVVMSSCSSGLLKVPQSAEIVIEGHILPGETMMEGPFGNHTGMYADPAPAPVVRIDKVSMHDAAIYPCTVVGPPLMENVYMAKAAERLLLPLLQYDHPWVSDVYMPLEGIYHRAAMVAVKDATKLNLADIQVALRSSLLLKKARLLVLLDAGVPLADMHQVYWHLLNKMNYAGEPGCLLVDARFPKGVRVVKQAGEIEQLIQERWPDYGLD